MTEQTGRTERLFAHRVPECPHCGHRHRYALLIGPRQEKQEPLLFAGRQEVTIRVLCPETRKSFETRITIGSGEQFLRIADPFVDHASDDHLPLATADEIDPELAEWMRSSRQTALEYCRTMLTTSTGAIPVHFAVLQYLDVSTIAARWTARAAAAPSLCFVLAAGAFALAQQPRLVQVADGSADSFAALRRMTLRRIDRLARWGTALFLLGIVGALIGFVALLGR
jgi:hypothetical protein